MTSLSISLLGTFRVTRNGSVVTGIESDKGRALLAYLATESRQAHRREALAALLWPDADQNKASQNIRRAIYNLRQALEGESGEGSVLLVSRQDVQFNSAAGHQVDVIRVSNLLDTAATHPHDRTDACHLCIERLQEAADLYPGDFLVGLSFLDSEPFEAWRAQKQENLHIRMMEALTHIAAYHKRRREYVDAIRYLRQQTALEPWREEAHYQLIEALALTGQTSAARQQYEICRRILQEELGIEPSPETTALHTRIQAEESRSPSLTTQDYVPNNLPSQLTQIIGREKELADVVALLMRDDVRLATLTGPGGTGKTRLSLQVAASLLDSFRDGVWLVELAAIVEPKLVIPTVAATLGIKESAGAPLINTLNEYLSDKRLLLVLDNFEQVIGAAKDVSHLLSSSAGVKVLCTSRIPLRVRGEREYAVPPLSLPDTRHLPSLEKLYHYEAVRLFIERATDVQADFEVTEDNARAVAEICVRLDGLPLAIELAAQRVRLFPPQALLTRLSQRLHVLTGGAHDLPARQQTLRGAIDWSYDLLDEGEKQLFRRIAPFTGGSTFDALEAVCNFDGNLKIGILEGADSLVSKSLLSVREVSRQRKRRDGEALFWMLETIQEFASEKLQESGEADELQRNHALYYMKLVGKAALQLAGPQQVQWLNRLDDEYDNVRAAIHWATERAQGGDLEGCEIGLRIVGAIWRFWEMRGLYTEGRELSARVLSTPQPVLAGCSSSSKAQAFTTSGVLALRQGDYSSARSLLEEALPLGREAGDKQTVARSLSALAIIAYLQADYSRARSLHEQSLALRRASGDKVGISASLQSLGGIAQAQGRYAEARTLYEESLALKRELGDKSGMAYSLGSLGYLSALQGDYEMARALHEESLALKRELGDKLGIADTLACLANVVRLHGNYAEAHTLYEQSLTLWREMGDKWGLAHCLNNLGNMVQAEGDYLKARALHEESLALRKEIGHKGGMAFSLNSLGDLAFALADYTTASSRYKESLTISEEIGLRSAIAHSLLGLGAVASAAPSEGTGGEQARRGARLLGASEQMLKTIGAVLEPESRAVYEYGTTSALARLGEVAFEQARQEGRAMSVEEAVACALRETPQKVVLQQV